MIFNDFSIGGFTLHEYFSDMIRDLSYEVNATNFSDCFDMVSPKTIDSAC